HTLAPRLSLRDALPICERDVAVDHDHPRAGARQEDRGGATVADAVAGGAAARHDGDLPGQSPAIRYVEACRCVGHVFPLSGPRVSGHRARHGGADSITAANRTRWPSGLASSTLASRILRTNGTCTMGLLQTSTA